MASENPQLDAQAFALFERSLKQERKHRRQWIIEHAGENTQLREKTLALLSSDESGPDILMTGAAVTESYVDETPPERIGVYKICEKLGQGGMGTVYRAERDIGDFDHVVAIKLIKPGIISDGLKDRFAHEQQVMAGFSHPNIAHLYDGGTTDEGVPYIIMELIDGVSITDWVRQNALDEKQYLALFRSACQAVAYAHQNLIIHRDLTPGNVLVTKDGVVKLIDFGIAKPYEESAPAQDLAPSLASLSFTPGFAAPERSKGAAANTLSDIYSLGKLLENIVPAAKMNADLQAIYNKATAREPEDRYASVDALIDDLDNYVSGYPVAARRGTTAYKLGKIFMRNKAATALGGLVFAGLIGGLITTMTLYHQAETARLDADSRFKEVRELATFMLFDLYDELKTTPGNTKALSSIADKSREYLDVLTRDTRASLEINLETAIGYKRLSDVVGNPITTNLGRREETAELLAIAYEKLDRLHRAYPENPKIMRALAETAYSYSVFEFIAQDNNKLTRKYAQKAEELYQRLIQKMTGQEDDVVGLFRARLETAKTYYWDGKGEEGIKSLTSLSGEIAHYVARHKISLQMALAQAAVLTETALTMSSHYSVAGGDAHDALPYINKAILIYQELSRSHPDNFLPKRNLVGVLYKRALIYSELKDYASMLADLTKSDVMASQFLTKDPNDSGMLRIAMAVRQLKSKTLGRMGRFEAAIALGENILTSIKQAYDREPDSPGRAREYANAQANLAGILEQAGRQKKACAHYRKTLDVWKTIQERWGISDFDQKDSVEKVKKYLATCS